MQQEIRQERQAGLGEPDGGTGPGLPQEVVERGAAGERSAQERILREYHSFVRRMLYRLAGPIDELEDVQQMVLMRIVQKLPTYRHESTLRTWIGGICVNEVRQYFREHKRRRSRYALSNNVDDLSQADARQEGRLQKREALSHCLTALEKLSVEQRTVFVLKAVYGYTVDEIAAMTGAARSTTRLRLYHGRRKFFRSMRALDRGARMKPEDRE